MKMGRTDKKSTSCFNFVLFGKAGSGKSAAGNTILGRKAFTSKKSPVSVTRDVAVERGTISGVPVTVYDTPGFFNTELSEDEIRRKCQSVFSSCESESDVCTYLLVIRADRFTEEEKKTVQKVEDMLGQSRMEKTQILFTGGDELEEEDQTIEDFISDTEPLKKLVKRYHDRYHVFNNKIRTDREQVKHLLGKVAKKLINTAQHLRRKKPTPPPPTITISRSDRRIVLLGKTGAGKSATGNTILGKKCFTSHLSCNSVTSESEACEGRVGDRKVRVIDTPGLYDTSAAPAQIAAKTVRSISLSSPGPHAFLIVLQLGRFTDQEMQIIEQIEMMFGQEVRKYAMVLFTHGDELQGENPEKLINENEALSKLVQQCGGGYHVFNNTERRKREQVSELLQKIDRMVEENGGTCYSNEMFEEAAKSRQEEEERKRRQEEERKQREEEQRQEEIENVKRETEARVRRKIEKEQMQSENRDTQTGEKTNTPTREMGNTSQADSGNTTNPDDDKGVWGFFKEKWWIILLAAVVGAGVGAGVAVAVVGAEAIGLSVGAVVGAVVGVGAVAVGGAVGGVGAGAVGGAGAVVSGGLALMKKKQ